MPREGARVHLVSFNIHGIEVKKTQLEQKFNLLLPIIERATRNGYILCLQEVSLDFSERLHRFFRKWGYAMVTTSHEHYYGGSRGEAVAWPKTLFTHVDSTLKNNLLCDRIRSRIKGDGKSCGSNDHCCKAAANKNKYMFATLMDRKTHLNFCVGTYHSPSTAGKSGHAVSRAIHATHLVNAFQDYCNGNEGILAGDFNLMPDEDVPWYKTILSGEISLLGSDYFLKPDNAAELTKRKCFPKSIAPMKSAYYEILGTERHKTHRSKHIPIPIDFIFCTMRWNVMDVDKPFPGWDRETPSGVIASDHAMIGADFQLSGKTTSLAKADIITTDSRPSGKARPIIYDKPIRSRHRSRSCCKRCCCCCCCCCRSCRF